MCRRDDLLGRDPEYLHRNCKICGDHFEDMMFANDLKNRLTPNAKPTLFDIPNPPAKLGQKRRTIQRTPHTEGE